MTHRLTIIFIFTVQQFLSQTSVYKILDVKPSTTKILTDVIDIYESYAFNSFTLFVGWTIETKSLPQTPKIIIRDKKGKVIFSKIGQTDSYIFRPTFFASDIDKDPTLFLAESGSEYSWGNTIFKFSDNGVSELGHLDVANYDTLDNNSSNIAPVTLIEIRGEVLTFKFKTKQVVFNPGGQKEKIYDGSSISYLFKEGRLTLETHSR